jgi:hypothetical protein
MITKRKKYRKTKQYYKKTFFKVLFKNNGKKMKFKKTYISKITVKKHPFFKVLYFLQLFSGWKRKQLFFRKYQN